MLNKIVGEFNDRFLGSWLANDGIALSVRFNDLAISFARMTNGMRLVGGKLIMNVSHF